MIDCSRWTGNEREVVSDALKAYRASLRLRKSRSHSTMVQSDCQWRLVLIGQVLDAIDER